MNKFLQDIQSPYFWLTAVVLSLLVNLFSSYLKEWVDGLSQHFPHLIRERKKANEIRKKRYIEHNVAMIKANPMRLLLYLHKATLFTAGGGLLFLVFMVMAMDCWISLLSWIMDTNSSVPDPIGALMLAISALYGAARVRNTTALLWKTISTYLELNVYADGSLEPPVDLSPDQ